MKFLLNVNRGCWQNKLKLWSTLLINIMIYDSPPDVLALEREAVTLPRTPARHFYDLNKIPTVTITMWGILFISRLWPTPKNLVFQHEVTNLNPNPNPTPNPRREGGEVRAPFQSISHYSWRLSTMTMKTDHEERLTTKKTDHDNQDDSPRYDSAPFGLTRTRPCATFDIRGHAWVESFHCFAHCERTMRCVHCKTTCVYITFRLTKTCMCNN